MKLLFCVACGDVLALRREERTCACGRSAGRYVDRLNAKISGPSLALAFLNQNFLDVVEQQLSRGDPDEKLTAPPYTGETKGREFTAFVIPEIAPTVDRLDEGPYPRSTKEKSATDCKFPGLDTLKDEMRAVACGEKPASLDAEKPSVNLRDDIVAAIEAAEYGKVLINFEREVVAHLKMAQPLDPAQIDALRSLVAGTEVDPNAPIESDEDSDEKG